MGLGNANRSTGIRVNLSVVRNAKAENKISRLSPLHSPQFTLLFPACGSRCLTGLTSHKRRATEPAKGEISPEVRPCRLMYGFARMA